MPTVGIECQLFLRRQRPVGIVDAEHASPEKVPDRVQGQVHAIGLDVRLLGCIISQPDDVPSPHLVTGQHDC